MFEKYVFRVSKIPKYFSMCAKIQIIFRVSKKSFFLDLFFKIVNLHQCEMCGICTWKNSR